MEMTPIVVFDSDHHSNVGSVVWVRQDTRKSDITIGEWRIANTDCTISIAYGFKCIADANLKVLGAGHGTVLVVKFPDNSERYYHWGIGGSEIDTFLIPDQVLIDIGSIKAKNKSQYFHFPDLMWFNPCPTNEVTQKETLLVEIQRRLLATQGQEIKVDLNSRTKNMEKTIREYLVILLTDTPISYGPRGIEFSPSLGREILVRYVPCDPTAIVIRHNNQTFLRRGIHTIRKQTEDSKDRVVTKIIRYVQVDFTDFD